MKHKLLWGDLHNHNSVGLFHYSKGSLPRSIEIAKSHLDFFAFTGHAHWHDMPVMPNDGHLKWQEGFDHHTAMWPKTKELIRRANDKGRFTAFLGYEWHSAEFGDRSVIFPDDEGELLHAGHIRELEAHALASGALLIPHHLGYKSSLPGRGANWESINPAVSPVIEIYSEHGGAERDRGPWPYISHTNGPRTTLNSLAHALERGMRVGVTASTDDHFGCPGAYGEGLAAVYAEENTRRSIMEAICARRTYAVTGDRIELQFSINGSMMGSEVPTGDMTVTVSARGWDEIACVEVLKNNRVIHRHFPQDALPHPGVFSGPVKCRVEFGWGPWTALGIPRTADWRVDAGVSGGKFRGYMPAFQSGPFSEEKRNRVLEFGEDTCRWESYTSRQGAFLGVPTNAVVLEIDGNESTLFTLDIASPTQRKFTYSLGDLAGSSAIEFMDDFPCESFLVHRLVPEHMYTASFTFQDRGEPGDFYYVRLTQQNGQMAWSSPVWVSAR